MKKTNLLLNVVALLSVLACLSPLSAQSPARIEATSPKQFFGFEIGEDRKLADWKQLTDYFLLLDRESDRIRVSEAGKTTEGRPFLLVILSSPRNLDRLAELQKIQEQLADPRKTSEQAAEALIREGKTILAITCQIHSTEIASSQAAAEFAWQIATGRFPGTDQILDNTVILLVPSLNPDGHQMVTEWYRKYLGTPYEGSGPVELYQKYVGHDNNRDWYTFTQAETRVFVEKVYNPWRPHILYDVHQMGGSGARLFLPPWVDPVDPNIDPILVQTSQALGSDAALELLARGKKGVVTNQSFDLWSPGRQYSFYHGGARILSEAASARIATPVEVPASSEERLPSWKNPDPWPGGVWRLRDIVDYELAVFAAVARNAAAHRERYLRNSRTISQRTMTRAGWPYAFVISAEQKDPHAAARLVETLRFGAIEVEQALKDFEAEGRRFAAGSYVVRLQQPYAGWAKTLLEKQQYPNLTQYPGGPPLRPYDVTAQTLPLLFGVDVATVEKTFEASLRPVTTVATPQGVVDAATGAGYRINANTNAEIFALVDLLSEGVPVIRSAQGAYIPAGANQKVLESVASARGIRIAAAATVPERAALALSAPRVAIYKSWVSTADEGWTRWIFDTQKLPYQSVTDADFRTGNLRSRFDAIILPDNTAAAILKGNGSRGRGGQVPPEYRGGIGQQGLAALKAFAEEGGTIIALNRASLFITEHFGGAPANALGTIPGKDFYCPGSILRVHLDTNHPVAFGADSETPVFFHLSPAFTSGGNAKTIAQYGEGDPLLSGWLLGGDKLPGTAALSELPIGKGRAILFGFRPQYRAQTEVTYKLLLNSILYSAAKLTRPQTASAGGGSGF